MKRLLDRLRYFVKYLNHGMSLDSAWRIAGDIADPRQRWRQMWQKPFDWAKFTKEQKHG